MGLSMMRRALAQSCFSNHTAYQGDFITMCDQNEDDICSLKKNKN